jgi:hypothetical protein
MYGHGIAILALAEAYGVEPDPRRRRAIRNVLERGVKVILDAQNVAKPPEHAGGWRYEPGAADSDLSLSGWNALALRACQNVGVAVPKEAIDRAVRYVMTCYKPEAQGFAYQVSRNATATMTAVGLLNLYLLEAGDRPELLAAAEFMRTHAGQRQTHPYYARYYITQAAYQAGGAAWAEIWSRTRQELVSTIGEDGGWPASTEKTEPGRVYATSMSVLTLTVPYRLLPIYQR